MNPYYSVCFASSQGRDLSRAASWSSGAAAKSKFFILIVLHHNLHRRCSIDFIDSEMLLTAQPAQVRLYISRIKTNCTGFGLWSVFPQHTDSGNPSSSSGLSPHRLRAVPNTEVGSSHCITRRLIEFDLPSGLHVPAFARRTKVHHRHSAGAAGALTQGLKQKPMKVSRN